jgi:hypothetical protein
MNALTWKILAVGLGLLGWSGTAVLAEAATLVVLSLECLEPEDHDRDEPELVVVSGGRTRSFRFTRMTRGDIVPRGGGVIGRIPINGRTSIILYDRDNGRTDWFDSDDYLGMRIISGNPTNGVQELRFNGDGAFYKLRFRVDL